MNHTRVLAAVGLTAALALASNAQAAQVGFYIGGFYGQTDKESNIGDFDAFANNVYNNFGLAVQSGTSSLDDSFNGYGFYGGYRFNTHLAVEGGYLNLGSMKYRSRVNGNIDGVPSDGLLNFDSETSGLALSAVGVYPLSYRWEVYGRAGVLFASNTASVFFADAEGSLPLEFSENSVDALAGVGTSFNFLEIYDLRLEYQRVFDAGDEATGEGSADMISLGISVVF